MWKMGDRVDRSEVLSNILEVDVNRRLALCTAKPDSMLSKHDFWFFER